MTDDLVQWLRDQLDEGERIAREAHAVNWSTDGRRGLHYGVESGWMTDALTTGDADHIAAHDPARVLREIDAKRQLLERQLLELHAPAALHDGCEICDAGNDSCGCMGGRHWGYPCDTIKVLALPYADRPGYREDWRP